jgi:adenosylmethionine-8-amino-7-oxononanoate aminotransferase
MIRVTGDTIALSPPLVVRVEQVSEILGRSRGSCRILTKNGLPSLTLGVVR